MFTDGNKTIIGIPCSNILANVYIGTSPFSLMGNHTVHEDSFKYKYRIENSWYRSSFIWTSARTDGSQNYLEHWLKF